MFGKAQAILAQCGTESQCQISYWCFSYLYGMWKMGILLLLLCACQHKNNCTWHDGQEFDTCYVERYRNGDVTHVYIKGNEVVRACFVKPPPLPPPSGDALLAKDTIGRVSGTK